jgi:hypothetical protein
MRLHVLVEGSADAAFSELGSLAFSAAIPRMLSNTEGRGVSPGNRPSLQTPGVKAFSTSSPRNFELMAKR